MIIRTTTDPISLNEVPDPESHPCIFEGDGDNGIEIYFKTEQNRLTYLEMKSDGKFTLKGDDSDDYVAEG